MKRIYGIGIIAALFALTATAQDAESKKQLDAQAVAIQKQLDETISTLKMTVIRTEGGVMSSVKNAPYRADQITENTQTLGDGTRIHNEHQVTIYRDSQGRVRREQPNGEVSIWDPTSEASYTLNPENMTARKMHVSVSVKSGGAGGLDTVRDGAAVFAFGGRGEDMPVILSQIVTDGPGGERERKEGKGGGMVTIGSKTVTMMDQKKESLGTQTMEGVNAQGERQTRTIEAGDIGNDRPIQIVSERWYAPDLQVEVMTRHSDPRTGEEIMRLTNINRAEPDPSLFQVPVGYQIVEGPAAKGGRGGRQ